ncbi:MAG: SGNH/GDSL hydrolase family protein [Anaerolineae bacterium]
MRIVFVGDSLTEGIPGCSYVKLLQQRLPEHTLVNLGEGNDTVISLHHRITHLVLEGSFDLAFLWVGVNDVLRRFSSWTFRASDVILRDPHAMHPGEFVAYYDATLDYLKAYARRIVAVSPLLKGEAPGNPWNRQLAAYAEDIRALTSDDPDIDYLDLRTPILHYLEGRSVSNYLPPNALRVLFDALWLRTEKQIDARSRQRGLQVTLDGVHLNSTGARLVADEFERLIRAHAETI